MRLNQIFRYLPSALAVTFAGCLLLAASPITAVAAPIPVKSATPQYTITDLGEQPTIAADVAARINSAGQVALWRQGADETVHAYVVSSQGEQAIASVPGYPNTIPHSINDKGDVVGWTNSTGNPVDSRSTTRGFVWRKGQTQLIGTLGGRDSRAFGINNAGQIVGVSDLKNGTRHAFLMVGSLISDLGTLPGADFSEAIAISSAGDIVGTSSVKGHAKHAVLWRKGNIFDLGVLPDGGVSSARAINNRGQIAGFSETPDGYNAFIWTKGVMTDLGTLGADPSTATSINDNGQIVGSSDFAADRGHAFFWQKGQMVDLNSIVAPGSQWTLNDAYAINNNGLIVASGNRDKESAHFLLLTPVKSK